MKDLLGKHRWDNRPIKNPTQTRFLRFRKGPRGEIQSSFSDAVKGFNKSMKPYKTIYEKEFGEL